MFKDAENEPSKAYKAKLEVFIDAYNKMPEKNDFLKNLKENHLKDADNNLEDLTDNTEIQEDLTKNDLVDLNNNNNNLIQHSYKEENTVVDNSEIVNKYLEANIIDLENKLDKATSYCQRVLILEKIKSLRLNYEFNPVLEEQDLGEVFNTRLKEFKKQIRAIFLEKSLFVDDIIYAEYKRSRRLSKQYNIKFTKELSEDNIDKILKVSDKATEKQKARWYDSLDKISKNTLTVNSKEFDIEDIQHHIKNQSNYFSKKLSQEQTEYIFNFLKENCEITETDPDWTFAKELQYNLFAEIISGEDEEKVIEKLLAKGAKLNNNVLHYKDFPDEGKRYSINLGNDSYIHYVPHYSVGTELINEYKHTYKLKSINQETVNNLLKDIDKAFEQHIIYPKDVIITHEVYDNPKYDDKFLAVQKDRVKDDYWTKLEKILESGCYIEKDKPLKEKDKKKHPYKQPNTKYARNLYTLKATTERLKEFDGYYIYLGDNKFMYHYNYKAWQRLKEHTKKLVEFKSFQISFISEFGQFANKAGDKQTKVNYEHFKNKLIKHLNAKDMHKDFTYLFSNNSDLFNKKVIEKETLKKIQHNAPYSERGILRLENIEPAKGIEIVKELGFCANICSAVPYNLIYRGYHRKGRVTPLHPDYASGKKDIKLPDNNMIMHGLTASGNNIIDHFKQIVNTGGLKSISERRRMYLNVGGMSVHGDIGSGIDVGVSTKIGTSPTYGGGIFFLIKPEALKRRDLFFSPQDYGGGTGRYASYTNYAKSIGQGKIHYPASDTARKKHLKDGLGHSNECYLKYEISFDEVDSLVVTGEKKTYENICEIVNKYKEQGLLPKELVVLSSKDKYNGDIVKLVKERAKLYK